MKKSSILSVVLFTLCLWPIVMTGPASGAPSGASGAEAQTLVHAFFPNLDLARKAVRSFDALESDYEKGYLVMSLTDAQIDALFNLGFTIEVQTQQDLQAFLNAQAAPTAEAAGIPGYSCYRTVEETFATAQQIAADYPNLATWSDVGDSWEKTAGLGGYDMMVLKLTNAAVAGPKPILFMSAAIHAREYATAELVTRFAEFLVDSYGTDADATWILDYHEVHLLLMTNPDGRKKAETGILWRKNTNQNYCGATSNYRGADLNRNFEFHWGCCNGSSGYACDEDYRGPGAASEPETQAVQNYVRSLFPDLRGPNDDDPAPDDTAGIYLDIHSHGRLVLWPWGHTSAPAPNATQLQTLGRKFAYWNNHSPEQSIGLYPTDGTTDGVGYGELGVPSFTFELGTTFFQSCSYFENTILPDNLPSLLYAAKAVRTPYLTPAGPDAHDLALSAGAEPPGVAAGTPVTLQATINDTRYNNSNGTEPTQNIAQARYYIDSPPWAGGTPNTMSASDGSLNSTSEGAQAALDTSVLGVGQHIIFVQGRDALGNWGAVSAVFLYINDGSSNLPPTAGFTYTTSGLDVTFSDTSTDTDGVITAWDWDFGDGTNSTQQNPAHTYGTDGTYTVSLTVTDNGGLTDTYSTGIQVSSAPSYCAASATNNQYEWIARVQVGTLDNPSGAAGYTDFTAHTVNAEAGQTLSVSLTPGFAGSAYAEYWKIWIDYNQDGDFADSGEEVFSKSGSSTVSDTFSVPASAEGVVTRMRVAMQYNSYPPYCGNFTYGEVEDYTVAIQAAVVIPPVADFSASATEINAGQSVVFADQSVNTPTSWSWSFEGGTPAGSTARNPSITYASAGIYAVTLTVANAAGSDTFTRDNYITVYDNPVTYCASAGNSNRYEWIAGVQAGTLNNPSGASGYSDFTAFSLTASGGSSVSLTLTPGFAGSAYNEYWRVWIDYNADGDFDDAGETVFSQSGRSVVAGSFTLPASAAGTTTRMRVSMHYNSYPPACGNFSYGEVEDYTVVVE